MNSSTTVTELVERIGQMLEPSGIQSFRTDYKVTANGASRRYLVVEQGNEKPRYAVLSPREKPREIGVSRMKKYAQMSDEDANLVLDLAHELSEINDIGSWPIGPGPEIEKRVVNAEGIGALDYGAYPALAHSYDFLNEVLGERISHIDIDVRNLRTKRGQRRHAWHTYYDLDGNQVASFNTQVTGATINQWLFPSQQSDQDAMERYVRGWGGQLQVAPDVMASAFMEALKLDQLLSVTRVDLA